MIEVHNVHVTSMGYLDIMKRKRSLKLSLLYDIYTRGRKNKEYERTTQFVCNQKVLKK